MIAVIDYGAGNVRSVHKALVAVCGDDAAVQVTQDPLQVIKAAKVVLPGVGAFGDCMRALDELDLVGAIYEAVERRGVPFLGICVGMQVLFTEGLEMGRHRGLDLLPGQVTRFEVDATLKVPHTGWNEVEPRQASPLLAELPVPAWAYFNHGYVCRARDEHVLATTDYGGPFASVVGYENVSGVQFHPEKSQHVGLHVLRNFVTRM